MRYSSRREAIMDAVRSTVCHPDAEWVYAQVRRKLPSVSLGTVYRNLRALTEAGELATVETESGTLHFDADLSPHAHFVCKVCGAIIDTPALHAPAEVWQQSGYAVDCVKTVAYGTCPRCIGKETMHRA